MLTIEQFVKENIKFITKNQIAKVYQYLDIPCEPLYKTKKNELLLELQYDNINMLDIYKVLKDEQFGISVTGASEQLGISKYKVNKLIEKGLFKVIYERINHNHGKAIMCKFIRYEDVYKYYKERLIYDSSKS